VSEPTYVPVATLRRAADVLLEHLEELEGPVVSLDNDYFWAIPPEQLYDVMHQPSELTIGQLTECLEHLDALITDPTQATSYALVWFADLARAVGQAVIK
jgi:hypothetical protein